MKYPFTIQTTSNNEFTEPQLIKNEIDNCAHSSFLPTLIYIDNWSSETNKKCSIEISVTCGDSMESGEISTAIISLWKGTISTAKIKLAEHGDMHSIWIRARSMAGEIINISGYIEIHDPNNMPVAGFEIADDREKK
jgi:hypothetical protein